MNQSIQFPDREIINAQAQLIIFPVLIDGMLLNCKISFSALQKHFGSVNNDLEQLKTLFSTHRWDIEEKIEEMIKHQDYVDELVLD